MPTGKKIMPSDNMSREEFEDLDATRGAVVIQTGPTAASRPDGETQESAGGDDEDGADGE